MNGTARRILIFGAGNIGMSFVGQIFARSGWEIVFADADRSVVERINALGSYTVELVAPDGGRERHLINAARAVAVQDRDALAAELRAMPLIATSVGARAFPRVMETLDKLAPHPAELDVIAAENMHDPRREAREILAERVPGVHACSVGKMVPLQTPTHEGPIVLRGEDFNTLIVDGADWRRPFPDSVRWLQPVDDIHAWMDRKLFVHNLGHSACAWHARRVAPEAPTIAEAITVPSVRVHTEQVMRAAAETLRAAYPQAFSADDLAVHVTDLLRRFGNVALGDTVERVGRDVERKLGAEERLLGALRLATSHRGGALVDLAGTICVDALHFGSGPGATLKRDREIARLAVPLLAAGRRDELRVLLGQLTGLDAARDPDRSLLAALLP